MSIMTFQQYFELMQQPQQPNGQSNNKQQLDPNVAAAAATPGQENKARDLAKRVNIGIQKTGGKIDPKDIAKAIGVLDQAKTN